MFSTAESRLFNYMTHWIVNYLSRNIGTYHGSMVHRFNGFSTCRAGHIAKAAN